MSVEGSELYGESIGDTSDSMADSDAVNILNSLAPMRQTGAISWCAPKFQAWGFRLTIKADFASAVDTRKRLKEHIS